MAPPPNTVPPAVAHMQTVSLYLDLAALSCSTIVDNLKGWTHMHRHRMSALTLAQVPPPPPHSIAQLLQTHPPLLSNSHPTPPHHNFISWESHSHESQCLYFVVWSHLLVGIAVGCGSAPSLGLEAEKKPVGSKVKVQRSGAYHSEV